MQPFGSNLRSSKDSEDNEAGRTSTSLRRNIIINESDDNKGARTSRTLVRNIIKNNRKDNNSSITDEQSGVPKSDVSISCSDKRKLSTGK